MIIPIRCMTCGKILADKWFKYLELVKEKTGVTTDDNLLDINLKNIKKTPEGEALDELNLKRYCCRTIMLSTINIYTNLL